METSCVLRRPTSRQSYAGSDSAPLKTAVTPVTMPMRWGKRLRDAEHISTEAERCTIFPRFTDMAIISQSPMTTNYPIGRVRTTFWTPEFSSFRARPRLLHLLNLLLAFCLPRAVSLLHAPHPSSRTALLWEWVDGRTAAAWVTGTRRRRCRLTRSWRLWSSLCQASVRSFIAHSSEKSKSVLPFQSYRLLTQMAV
jgi:hypothetical protein